MYFVKDKGDNNDNLYRCVVPASNIAHAANNVNFAGNNVNGRRGAKRREKAMEWGEKRTVALH